MNRRIQWVRWFNHAWPGNRLKHALARWGAERLGETRGPKTYGGIQGDLRMRLDLASEYERWIYFNVYELVITRLLGRILQPGDTFVDGGANLGLMTLVAARRIGPTGRVYAFEPQPDALGRLRENLKLNDISNVNVIPKGCWDESSTCTLYAYEGQNIGMASMREQPEEGAGREVEAQTVRIDGVAAGPVKLLKLDVEGAELAALRGAEGLFKADAPPHLIVELNPATTRAFDYHPIEIVDWVLQRHPGYQLHLIKSKRHRPIDRKHLAWLLDREPQRHRNVWFEPK